MHASLLCTLLAILVHFQSLKSFVFHNGLRFGGSIVQRRWNTLHNGISRNPPFKLAMVGRASPYEDDLLQEVDYDAYDDDDGDEEEDVKITAQQAKALNDKEWMFFDVARVNVQGGDGGDGCMAMRREYCIEMGGPSGGNGGNGGSVYFQCDKTLNTLATLRRKVHHRGKRGTRGKGDSRHGYNGDDLVVKVPPGTIVRDENLALAGELYNHGEMMMVARGGRGGRGNEHFKTSRMNAPAFSEIGEKGAVRWLNVELKLIADVGLVGVPNAGKSTLLAAASNAKPKIADYPFTTVVPNLGVCDIFPEDGLPEASLVIADIPGLLEGAHEGKGLGLAFLRHVQRCRVLIHVLKGDSEDVVGDYLAISQELELFNPKLTNKTEVIILNKIDIPEVRAKQVELIADLKQVAGHTRILPVSAATGENVKELMLRIRKLVESLPKQSYFELFGDDESTERVDFSAEDSAKYEIFTDDKYPGQYRIVGKKIEKIVEMTNWGYYESTMRFQRILEAEGISDALEEKGASQGDLVMIGDYDFNYWDRKNRWVAEMGLDNVNPRRRYDPTDDD